MRLPLSTMLRSLLAGALVLAGSCDVRIRSYVDPALLTAPRDLSYEAGEVALIVGQSFMTLRPRVQGLVRNWSIDPGLPAGLLLDPQSGEIAGRPVRPAPRREHVIKAENEFGEARTSLSIEVRVPPPRTLFVLDAGGGVQAFAADGFGGIPRPLAQTPDTTPLDPIRGLAIHPSGSVLIVSRTRSLAVHRPLALTGVLGDGQSVATSRNIADVVVDPNGRFVWALHDDGFATRWLFDEGTGSLRLPLQQRFGTQRVQLAFDPSGTIAFTLEPTLGRFEVLSVHADTGALLSSGAVTILPGASRFVLSPDRPALITIHPETHLLTSWVLRAGRLETDVVRLLGMRPRELSLDETGRRLLVLGEAPTSLHCCDVVTLESRGELALRGPAVAVSSAGRMLYAADPAGLRIAQVTADLNSVQWVIDLPTREPPVALALARSPEPISRHARSLLVLTGSNARLAPHSVVRGTGALQPGESVAAGSGANSLVLHPTQHVAFVARNGAQTISAFDVGSGGAVGAIPRVATADPMQRGPVALACEPTGRFLFVAYAETHAVGVHDAEPLAPAPRYLHSAATPLGPSALAVDPTGRFLVVACAAASRLAGYRIDDEGLLTLTAQAAVPAQPRHVTFDASGRFVYVACADADTIASFALDRASGALVPLELKPTARRPVFLAPHPSGIGLLACCDIADRVNFWTIDPRTGRLGTRTDAAATGGPITAAFDPGGLSVFLASHSGGSLDHFVLDPLLLTVALRAHAAIDSPLALAVVAGFVP